MKEASAQTLQHACAVLVHFCQVFFQAGGMSLGSLFTSNIAKLRDLRDPGRDPLEICG